MLPASIYDASAESDEGKARAKEFFATPLMAAATGHVLGGVVNDVAGNETATSPSMRHTAQELLFPLEWIETIGGITNATAILNEYVPAPDAVPIFNHDARNLDLLDPLGEPHGLGWQELCEFEQSVWRFRFGIAPHSCVLGLRTFCSIVDSHTERTARRLGLQPPASQDDQASLRPEQGVSVPRLSHRRRRGVGRRVAYCILYRESVSVRLLAVAFGARRKV